MKGRLKAVLFDVDGTLVDSNDAHAKAWAKAFTENGDTPYDIEAASRAGVAAMAFRSGGWSDADLKGAVAIYDGPWDLLARISDSTLVRGFRPVDR